MLAVEFDYKLVAGCNGKVDGCINKPSSLMDKKSQKQIVDTQTTNMVVVWKEMNRLLGSGVKDKQAFPSFKADLEDP
jgi:hypothetical protein